MTDSTMNPQHTVVELHAAADRDRAAYK